jgi:hypothetical protein
MQRTVRATPRNAYAGICRFALAAALAAVFAGGVAAAATSEPPKAVEKKRAEPAATPVEGARSSGWAETLTRRNKAPTVDPRVFDGATWTPPPPAAPRTVEAPTVPPFPFTYAGRLTDGGATVRGDVHAPAEGTVGARHGKHGNRRDRPRCPSIRGPRA